MPAKLRTHLSFANIVSSIALFAALGGSAYAAITVTGKNVKNSSLTGKDIKNSSLATADVKNRSLLAADFKPGQLPAGAQGVQGAKGDTGPAGPFPDGNVPSGKTIRGNFAMASDAASTTGGVHASDNITFGFQLASAPTVRIISQGGTPPAQCPGTIASPQAAAGNLCIYEAQNVNADPLRTYDPAGGDDEANRWGTWLIADAIAVGKLYSAGTWAVTAP